MSGYEPITAEQVWTRYRYMRDNGHLQYVEKASKCEDFFAGKQWDEGDLATLKEQGRPALTINKILPVVSNLLGTQIFNRTDTSFKPRTGDAQAEVADALTKVFMQISDNNDLTWVRSDVFLDGLVTGRGFYDVRIDTEDSVQGEVRIKQLNPKNVLIDPDADSYRPARWNDVMYTEWQTVDDIALQYGDEVAERVRAQYLTASDYDTSTDISSYDRFGTDPAHAATTPDELSRGQRRDVRVLDYQFRCIDEQTVFVDSVRGDIRPVPANWSDERIQQYIAVNPQLGIDKRKRKRIRWMVVAGDEVLYDEWSPYEEYTIVPYFPNFVRGRTVGVVENLLSSQELLNKTSSQELHVVNTTANSGYFVKRNSLQNMSLAELEERGSSSGVVIELDDMGNIQKIPANPTPQGLDRISYKSEEHIKSISGVSDYMTGFAREDVSAKAVKANQAGSSAGTAHIQDSLNRSDFLLASVVLGLIQRFYTEERLVVVTTDRMTGDTGTMAVNQQTPDGTILNDLTLGEYAVVITNQPDRDTFEETQYDQALRLRTEAGVQLPDKYLIQASRLKDKAEILKEMAGEMTPEQQQMQQMQQELQMRMLQAEVMDKEAAAKLKMAQAEQALAKARGEGGDADADGIADTIELIIAREKLALEERRMRLDAAAKRYVADVSADTQITVEQMRLREKEQDRALEQAAQAKQMEDDEAAAYSERLLKAAEAYESEATKALDAPTPQTTPSEEPPTDGAQTNQDGVQP